MRNERWDLICECDPQKLAGLLSYLFSDEHIFISPRLQRALQADRKGFLTLEALQAEPLIADFFKTHEVAAEARRDSIQFVVEKYCSELRYSHNRVRRAVPFKKGGQKGIKPVCIDKLRATLTISDVREHLGATAFSPIEHFRPHDDIFLYVYAPNYRERMSDAQLMPFAVVEYQKLCEERERESRYWEQQEKRFYAAVSVEERAQREHRQHYARQEYRSRNAEHLRELTSEIEDEGPHEAAGDHSIDGLRAVFRPNVELNHLLGAFIAKLETRLDEE